VVVVIPARNEARMIGSTVRAAKAIHGVTRVLVCDDGSTDATRERAHAAGAAVAAHPTSRGKAGAMMTGIATLRHRDMFFDAVLFLDADLGDTAELAGALVAPVLAGTADLTIAVPPPAGPSAGGFGLVKGLARRGIRTATGLTLRAPLSGQRCITAAALAAAEPLASGWGVEVAMTIDVATAGFAVAEVDVAFTHRVTGRDLKSQLHRAAQLRDVARALGSRGVVPGVARVALPGRR
jgi:glycosyltransferase involved in cell wall biosynthesis